MQGAYQALRNQLWAKLETLYNKYPEQKGGEIPTSKVQIIIFEALGQQTQQEIDYVVKNMFRLDNDESGSISFEQFGNFLFKRHCGQMSLQKMHMNNQIKNGAQRKINLQQFHRLMNNAYKFLKVECPIETSKQIFNETDTDHDNLITYVQYFAVIDKYICKSKNTKVVRPVQSTGKQRSSRLRQYIWLQLKKLYQAYVHGRYLSANDQELRLLVTTIVGDLSDAEINFVLTDLFKLNMKFIQFQPFASHFIYLISQLSISKYSKYHLIAKKTLNRQQFAILYKNTYAFLSIGRIKMQFLYLAFQTIDKNKDGMITYDQYLDWIRRFLSVLKYFGDQFYFKEDDLDIQGQDMFEIERRPVQIKRSSNHVTFKFNDHTLAYAVRQRMYSLLIQYDANKDQLFNEDQIKIALTELLKEDPVQMKYVTQNVFRYDKDGDKHVTYDEFTNFSVEQHFGEMAIQRLHKRNFYSRGKERIMNEKQFMNTLNFSLAFIHLEATSDQVKNLFSQIDLDHDGWISYEVYFFFLKQYFGTNSVAAQKPKYQAQTKIGKLSQDQNLMYALQKLSVLQRFVRLLLDQLKEICMQYDFNKNMVFEPEQIEAILSQVFQLSRDQISYIMYNFFRFDVRKQKAATYEQLIAIILETYFIQILFKRKYHSQNSQSWINKRISIPQFLDLLYDSVFFIRVRPIRQDLLTIFEILDRDKDGYITFEEYITFVRKYLGRGLQIIDQPVKQVVLRPEPQIQGVSQQQQLFVEAIWSQLKNYFNKYDKGQKGYLNQQELKLFAIDVLHESSKRQLDYIFWNLFRVDSNSNHQVDFQQFAPFILNHAGQISLQRFHRQQIKGKDSLNEDQLYIVLSSAYAFLGSMPKNRPAISHIFRRISKGPTVSYSNLLQWVHNSLSKKFR